MMKAGKYWVGDLCYVMHADWKEVCSIVPDAHNSKNNEFSLADGTKFTFKYTAYGDGTYYDESGKNYPVDAGLIGCILVSDIKEHDWNSLDGGHVIDFEEDFEAKYHKGTISFGDKVAIDTDPEDEDDEYCDGYYTKDDFEDE